MADNYLEKRMEDLRSGRSARVSSGMPGVANRKGMLAFRFPPRRVVVIGENAELCPVVLKGFSSLDCRTALVSGNENLCAEMRHGGVRVVFNAPAGGAGESDKELFRSGLSEALSGIFTAWRDIDIIVLIRQDRQNISFAAEIWRDLKSTLPCQSDYEGRMLLIGAENQDIQHDGNFIISRIELDSREGDNDEKIMRDLASICKLICATSFKSAINIRIVG